MTAGSLVLNNHIRYMHVTMMLCFVPDIIAFVAFIASQKVKVRRQGL